MPWVAYGGLLAYQPAYPQKVANSAQVTDVAFQVKFFFFDTLIFEQKDVRESRIGILKDIAINLGDGILVDLFFKGFTNLGFDILGTILFIIFWNF